MPAVHVPSFRRHLTPLGVVLFVVVMSLTFAVVPLPRSAVAGLGPSITVDRDNDAISGEGWLPAATVTITIERSTPSGNPDAATYQTHAAVDSSSNFYAQVGTSFDIRPGDVVTVTQGATTETHTVTDLWIDGSDETMDMVLGSAEWNATIRSWIEPTSREVITQADENGDWIIDFAQTNMGPYDLKAGDLLGFAEKDGTNNWTVIHRAVPIARDNDRDTIPDATDNCEGLANSTQYDGDGDGIGARCDRVDRLSGPNRYGTSAAVSKMAFEYADEVFIALGTNFPDALVAGAAAGYRNGPVLLTSPDSLPPETAAELSRLRPVTAYIVGGTGAISQHVADQVGALVPHVVRLAGKDRYETSAAVSKEIFQKAPVAFVASGENFPDALVAAAAAGFLSAPVLLTRKDRVPKATIDELNRLHPATIYIVGGTVPVSASAAQVLAQYGKVVRLAGTNRYGTSAKVAEQFYNCFTCDTRAFLAYGGNFPDALVAAAAGGSFQAPVLLVTRDSIPAPTREQLDRLDVEHGNVWVVGGTAVIGDDVFNALP